MTRGHTSIDHKQEIDLWGLSIWALQSMEVNFNKNDWKKTKNDCVSTRLSVKTFGNKTYIVCFDSNAVCVSRPFQSGIIRNS